LATALSLLRLPPSMPRRRVLGDLAARATAEPPQHGARRQHPDCQPRDGHERDGHGARSIYHGSASLDSFLTLLPQEALQGALLHAPMAPGLQPGGAGLS